MPGHKRPPQDQDAAEEQVNEYELQREERIRRNREVMHQMGVQFAASALANGVAPGGQTGRTAGNRMPAPASKPAKTRRCTRLASAASADTSSESSGPVPKAADDELMTLENFFKWKGQPVEPLMVDGRYRGWVCPEIAARYRIPHEDGAAASQPAGAGSRAARAAQGQHGWSNARAFSSTMLTSNPNAFFYRHVAPHEEQATGEWTEEEHELFMGTARAQGVGDRWGLFASHIPQRVGYQCSAYYRERVIPQGLIFDPRFRLTRTGAAVFAG